MSSSSAVITVDRAWKRYKLGGRRLSRKRTLAGEVTSALERAGLKRGDGSSRIVWALADVSFEVSDGEAVGIIGANGSGKSTALKLMSGITQPWSGNVTTRGRVGSLIEIRSGIHPELTGRENLFLYGTILGFSRKEIKRRFDEIVDFAEIGRFIDTPVKRYSSGMEVRLGFSVAVHLDPDILLVDEVLSVGDAAFQRRCLERMGKMRAQGQTLVFVSHVLKDVENLCARVVYLDRAVVRADGPADAVIDLYLEDVERRRAATSAS
ncbi:MAG: ABC transporter ATP-binding protein [Actinomycetota bacterium]